MDWIEQELQQLTLGNERLNNRGRLLLERFFADPQASINASCHGWALWRGLRRLRDFALAWQCFGPECCERPERHNRASPRRKNVRTYV